MYRLQRFFTRRNIIITLGIVLVLFSAWFVIFHGFIKLEGSLSNKQTSYYQFDGSLRKSNSGKISQSGMLVSGDYVFEALMKNGGLYSSSATVPHLLGTKTIDIPDHESLITAIGRRTARSVATSKSGLVSWSTRGSAYKLDSRNISSDIDTQAPLRLNNLRSMATYRNLSQLSASKIVGLKPLGDNSYAPVVYDFNTDRLFSYPSLEGGSIFLQREARGFSTYNKSKSIVSYYQDGSSDIKQKNINEGDRIMLYDGKPVYSFMGGSVSRLVTATGPAIFSGGDLPENFKDNGETSTVISVFDTKKDTRITQLAIDKAPLIKLSLSLDGKYVAAVTTESTTIYNVSNLSKIITLPYTTGDDIFWLDSGDLIFNADENGILQISPSKQRAHSLVPYSLIRPAKLSFIDGDNLYLTGFSSINDFNTNPDAYRLSLSKNTTPIQRKIFRSFPHQGDGYYVDYLDNQVTVQLSRYITSRGTMVSQSAKEEAFDYVDSVFEGKKQINFVYITTDLRIRDDGDE